MINRLSCKTKPFVTSFKLAQLVKLDFILGEIEYTFWIGSVITLQGINVSRYFDTVCLISGKNYRTCESAFHWFKFTTRSSLMKQMALQL